MGDTGVILIRGPHEGEHIQDESQGEEPRRSQTPGKGMRRREGNTAPCAQTSCKRVSLPGASYLPRQSISSGACGHEKMTFLQIQSLGSAGMLLSGHRAGGIEREREEEGQLGPAKGLEMKVLASGWAQHRLNWDRLALGQPGRDWETLSPVDTVLLIRQWLASTFSRPSVLTSVSATQTRKYKPLAPSLHRKAGRGESYCCPSGWP